MTCTATKPDTWTGMFCAQNCQQKSFIFVKKLLAIAVSNITYLRSIFPDYAYGDRSLEGLNLKILRGDANASCGRLVKWLAGCYDAIEKCYLKQMTIGIFEKDDDPEFLIESYTFQFAYNGEVSMTMLKDERQVSTVSANMKSSALTMIRSILLLMQALKPLPEHIDMTIKLLYFDEVTPPDYEPPGFMACESTSFSYRHELFNLEMGQVETPYHKLSLRVRSDKRQFEETDDTVTLHDASTIIQHLENQKNTQEQVEDRVRCSCGLNEDDGVMIMCEVCKHWQHMICYRILDEKEAPEHHICHYCVELSNQTRLATDPSLTHLSASTLQTTCIWRRCLLACLEMNRVTTKQIKNRLGVNDAIAESLVLRLANEGFVDEKGKNLRIGQKINKDRIRQTGIPKYIFLQHVRQPLEESPIINRLNVVRCNEQEGENDDDIEQLTTEAEKLNVKDVSFAKPRSVTGTTKTATASRKRVRLQLDKNQVFDVLGSQDTMNGSFEVPDAGPVIKKAKASINKRRVNLR